MKQTYSLISALAVTAALSNAPVFAHDGSGAGSTNADAAGHLDAPTLLQLQDVVNATARFQDVERATDENYVDIGVDVAHMGHHYLNQDLLDGQFDPEKPELLVYADDPCGGARRLVAVEYAVPLDLARKAPDGFVGKSDVWDVNDEFQLWTLHAWVWKYNPDGVFAPLNPQVP